MRILTEVCAVGLSPTPVVGSRRCDHELVWPLESCASVLGDAGSQTDPINRSKPLWTVTFEQPGFQTKVRSVTTAWVAGT